MNRCTRMRCCRALWLAAAMVGVALLGCHTVPDDGELPAGAAAPVLAPPWPEERALALLAGLLAEDSPTIVAITRTLSFDCGGVGVDISASQEKDAAGLYVFVASCADGVFPAVNDISVRGDDSYEKNDGFRWRELRVPACSELEAKLVELAQKVAESSPEPVVRYNAKELLAVLGDRKHPCEWRRFWYGDETYGDGYGARYREKYGDAEE